MVVAASVGLARSIHCRFHYHVVADVDSDVLNSCWPLSHDLTTRSPYFHCLP